MENIASTLGVGDKRDSDITLEMMDYKYINECSNVKTIERILKSLRSGRDGYFPHLIKHCEEKLADLNPKSRYLRTENKVLKPRDLSTEDADSLSNGMGEWINSMKSNETIGNGNLEKELPPVRSNAQSVSKNGTSSKSKKKSNRIKGSDFKAWDKFDADEECKKVDEPDPVAPKKDINIPHTVDSSKMTEAEKQIAADKEKDKGNEAFKAGDYKEALAYYSRSISLVRTAASINNRALTYLRMEKWKEVERDCGEVLLLEKDNIKAKLRRATALKELSRYKEAKDDLEFVLKMESNNLRAKKILEEVKSKMSTKGRKMKIMEVEEEEGEEAVITNGDSNRHKLEDEDDAHCSSNSILSNEEQQPTGVSSGGTIKSSVTREKKSAEDASKSMLEENEQNHATETQPDAQMKETKPDSKGSSQELETSNESILENAAVKVPDVELVKPPSTAEVVSDVEPVKPPPTAEVVVPKVEPAKPPPTAEVVVTKVEPAKPPPTAEVVVTTVEPVKPPPASEKAPEIEPAKPPPPAEVVHTPLPPVLERIKSQAGDLFRAGQYGDAADTYSKAITRLLAKSKKDSAANYSHALAVLYNNRAACMLKSGNDKACVEDCERVLKLKPSDIKALLRRASAYEHMEKYKLAYEDYRAAQTIDWTVSQAQDGANRVGKHLRDVYGSDWKSAKASVLQVDLNKPRSEPKTEKATPKLPESSVKKKSPKRSPNRSRNVANDRKTRGEASTSASKLRDEKRAQIVDKLFPKLKLEGNNLVRSGNYALAIDKYTYCIKICPEEVASYTNRALCFLKLNKNVSAAGDCSEAIRRDPNNVKAYYRRAQANKNLKLYGEAEKDLRKILTIEPSNKSAISELKEIKRLVEASSRKKIPIKEVSDEESSSGSEEEEERATGVFQSNSQSTLASESATDASTPSSDSFQAHSVKTTSTKSETTDTTGTTLPDVSSSRETIESNYSKTSTIESNYSKASTIESNYSKTSTIVTETNTGSTSGGDIPSFSKQESKSQKSTRQSEAAIPINRKMKTDLPSFRMQIPDNLTPYEFGNLWNAVQPKDNLEAYKCILDKIPTDLIPRMVSNKTTDHMIVIFAAISRKYLSNDSHEERIRAFDILQQLTKAQRFDMAAMFLSKTDKAQVSSAFEGLANFVNSKAASFTADDLHKLKKAYML